MDITILCLYSNILLFSGLYGLRPFFIGTIVVLSLLKRDALDVRPLQKRKFLFIDTVVHDTNEKAFVNKICVSLSSKNTKQSFWETTDVASFSTKVLGIANF